MSMQERRKRTLLVDRDKIEWYPTIDSEQCTGCKVCFTFCPKKVYSLDEAGGITLVHVAQRGPAREADQQHGHEEECAQQGQADADFKVSELHRRLVLKMSERQA